MPDWFDIVKDVGLAVVSAVSAAIGGRALHSYKKKSSTERERDLAIKATMDAVIATRHELDKHALTHQHLSDEVGEIKLRQSSLSARFGRARLDGYRERLDASEGEIRRLTAANAECETRCDQLRKDFESLKLVVDRVNGEKT